MGERPISLRVRAREFLGQAVQQIFLGDSGYPVIAQFRRTRRTRITGDYEQTVQLPADSRRFNYQPIIAGAIHVAAHTMLTSVPMMNRSRAAEFSSSENRPRPLMATTMATAAN